MMRLQELVDKLQLKVKVYKRQAEEAVSDIFLTISTVKNFCRLLLIISASSDRKNKPTLISLS